MDLCCQRDDQTTESLWVRQRTQTSIGDTVMGVCYGLPHQEEAVYDAFKQVEEASQLQDAGPGPQPPWYLLEEQHNSAQVIQEVCGVH